MLFNVPPPDLDDWGRRIPILSGEYFSALSALHVSLGVPPLNPKLTKTHEDFYLLTKEQIYFFVWHGAITAQTQISREIESWTEAAA